MLEGWTQACVGGLDCVFDTHTRIHTHTHTTHTHTHTHAHTPTDHNSFSQSFPCSLMRDLPPGLIETPSLSVSMETSDTLPNVVVKGGDIAVNWTTSSHCTANHILRALLLDVNTVRSECLKPITLPLSNLCPLYRGRSRGGGAVEACCLQHTLYRGGSLGGGAVEACCLQHTLYRGGSRGGGAVEACCLQHTLYRGGSRGGGAVEACCLLWKSFVYS